MNKIKDKKIIVLVAVFFVFTISYFLLVSSVSHAFDVDNSVNSNYEILMKLIEDGSKLYVEKHQDIFTDDFAYIKVQDLVDANILVPNSDNKVVNPKNKNQVLNENVIKIKKDKDNYIVEIDN